MFVIPKQLQDALKNVTLGNLNRINCIRLDSPEGSPQPRGLINLDVFKKLTYVALF